MPAGTSTYLDAHPGSRFTLGPSSTALPAGTVIAGADPYERAVSLADRFWPGSFATVGFAGGEAFPDGLTGDAHIVRQGGPLLLVKTLEIPQPLITYLMANQVTIATGFVYGGTTRIPDTIKNALLAAFM